jgi:hypothetical protein
LHSEYPRGTTPVPEDSGLGSSGLEKRFGNQVRAAIQGTELRLTAIQYSQVQIAPQVYNCLCHASQTLYFRIGFSDSSEADFSKVVWQNRVNTGEVRWAALVYAAGISKQGSDCGQGTAL